MAFYPGKYKLRVEQHGKADLAEITAQNGYPSGGSDVQNDYSEISNETVKIG